MNIVSSYEAHISIFFLDGTWRMSTSTLPRRIRRRFFTVTRWRREGPSIVDEIFSQRVQKPIHNPWVKSSVPNSKQPPPLGKSLSYFHWFLDLDRLSLNLSGTKPLSRIILISPSVMFHSGSVKKSLAPKSNASDGDPGGPSDTSGVSERRGLLALPPSLTFFLGGALVAWWFTLWLCQNSYWKWPFLVDFPMKNCDFP